MGERGDLPRQRLRVGTGHAWEGGATLLNPRPQG
jgi:hypothetical protein